MDLWSSRTMIRSCATGFANSDGNGLLAGVSAILPLSDYGRVSVMFFDQKIHRTWCLHESLKSGLQCAWKT